jgi:hypothetical protein
MTKLEKAFIFTVIVLMFQITRNISTAFYILVLFMSYCWLYYLFFFGNRRNIMIKKNIIEVFFTLTLIWIPIISLLFTNNSDYITAFARFFVTFPFMLFCFLYKDYNINLIRKVLRIICLFMAFSSLSIPYQILFGKIPFLADSGFREGLERYSSFAGSLTALGTLGGFSLAILLLSKNLLFSKYIRLVLIFITIVGMIMSLQKAAIINVALCLLIYLFVSRKGNFIKRLISLIFMCTILYIIYSYLKDTILGLYIDNLIKYSTSDSSVGTKSDLLDRMWEYPSIVISYNHLNAFNILTGVGFIALSGTLGLPNFPMSHNSYFDLLLSGGAFHLLLYIALLIRIPLNLFIKFIKGNVISNIDEIYSSVVLLIFINMLIGAATFYQPIGAVIIYFIIYSYNRINHQNNEQI